MRAGGWNEPERSRKWPCGGSSGGRTALGEIQRSGGSAVSGTRGPAGAGPVASAAAEVPRGVPAGQRGHVRGLGRVDQVPGREHQRRAGFQRGVHGRPTGARVEQHAAGPGQLMVRDPVAGKDEQVTADEPGRPGLRVGQLDAGQPGLPGDQLAPATSSVPAGATPAGRWPATTRLTAVFSHTGTRQRSRAPSAKAR